MNDDVDATRRPDGSQYQSRLRAFEIRKALKIQLTNQRQRLVYWITARDGCEQIAGASGPWPNAGRRSGLQMCTGNLHWLNPSATVRACFARKHQRSQSRYMTPLKTERPRRSDAELLARFQAKGPPPGASRLLGLRVTAIDQASQRIEASFQATPELCNPIGTVQGGILTAMLDELMSISAMVAANFSIVVPTLEIKTSYLRGAKPGPLHGWGRVVRLGRNVAFLEGALHDAEAQLIATANATALVIPRPARDAAAASNQSNSISLTA
jgi:uncharacterized protein (TIGR00369 family)